MHISLVERKHVTCVSSCQASITLIKPPHQSMKHIISVLEPEGTDEPVSPLIVLELDVLPDGPPFLSPVRDWCASLSFVWIYGHATVSTTFAVLTGNIHKVNGNDNACLTLCASDKCKLPGCCIRESLCTWISIGGKTVDGGKGREGWVLLVWAQSTIMIPNR